MWYGHWGWGLLFFGGLMRLAILIVLIWLIWRVVTDRRLRQGEGSSFHHIGAGSETPLDILKRRYAKGEINKDEFDRMKNELSG